MVREPVPPYTFKWHTGIDVSSPIVGATNPALNNRQGGATAFFTVLVTNTTSGCQNTRTLQVPDNRVLPLLSLTRSPNSICNPALTSPQVNFNGAVAATVTNQVGLITDYTFAWSNGATVEDLVNVTSGSYTLTTTHTPTGCVSNPVAAQVVDQTVLPVIAASANPSTNCAPGLENGQAIVNTIDTNPPAAPYVLLWHQGNDTTTPLAGETNALLDNRQGGVNELYTVLVTNQNTGCQNTSTVLIQDDREYPVVTLSEIDNTMCAGTPNGSATLATLTFDGAAVGSPYTGFTFDGHREQLRLQLRNSRQETTPWKRLRLMWVVLQLRFFIEIHDNFFIPPVNIASIDQTSCDVNNPNGMLTATIDETTIGGGAAVNTGYSFIWRDNGSGPALSIPGTTVTTTTATAGQINKLPGDKYYTVEVTRSSTGCVNTETVFLPEVIVYPIVVAANTNPVTRCDNPNGDMAANVGGVENGYTFLLVE
jgi:hypothetical protein